MNKTVLVPRNFKKTISVFRLMVTLILVLISTSFSQAQVTPSVIISSNATNNSVCRGTAVAFSATPTNGGATPTYQWKRNGVNIFTGSAITLNNIQINDQISVVMTTSLSAAEVTSTTATSNTITLTVNNLPSVLSKTPASITTCTSAGSATIDAVPTTGSVIDWYASTSSTNLLSTSSNSYTTPNISSTTTYYPVARDTVTGCQSNGLKSQNMAINMGPNNAYIQTPKTVTGSFTIEFWFKPAGSSSAGCASWRCGEGLVDANTGDASDRDFGITIYNSYVAFGMGNGSGNPDVSILSTTNVSTRIWRHIAASWDSTTGAMKLYVNGNLEASAIGGTGSRNGQSLMRLGALLQAPGNGFFGYFSGSLDEVRVWSKVRTQEDIQANYTTNLNGREDGLRQYYDFNQGIANNTYNGTQTTLYDITPNGNNGSLNQFVSLGNTGIQGTWWGTFDLGFDPAKYPVVVTKIPLPTVTSSTGSTICGSGATTLTAAASAGSKIDWYADASAGTALAIDTSNFTTPTLSATTTYYAEARDTVTGCVSTSRTAVTATVGAIPTAGITNNTGSTVLTCATTAISVTATGGSTYSWSNSLGSSANASITATGTYTVLVTGANGCTATSSITVTRDVTTPTAGITNNTGSTVVTCTTTSISVTATGGSTYSWSNSLGSSANASITASGTYTVTVTGSNGCTATSSITTTQNNTAPAAGITNNTGATILTCTRTSINVTATGVGSSYSWNNSLGSSASASITSPGTYTVTVTGANACTTTSSITVTRDITAPTAGITNNTGSTILNCTTPAISVTATGGASYSWSNSLGSSASASITSPGTYTVTVTGANNCTSTASITVTQNFTVPTAGITNNTGSTVLTCSTTAISVTATGVGSYSWSNSLGSSAAASITSPGTFTVTVTGTNGCTSTASITATQSNTIPSAPVVTNGSRCGDGTVTLSATSGTGTVVDWYASAMSSSPLLTASNTYTTTSLSSSTNYYLISRDTVTGCTSAKPRVTNALNFDGIDDNVNAGNGTSLQFNRGTIEAWIKTGNAGSQFRAIVCKQYAFGLFLQNNVLVWYDWRNLRRVSTGINLADNSWHHVALSFDARPNIKTANIYIDSILRAQDFFDISNQNDSLYIGKNTVSQQFAGTIDEVRVWNVVRTQSEIGASMNSDLSGTESGLVAFYNFNQGVAGGTNTNITSLTDLTSNSNNASINNFTLTGNTSNFVNGPALSPITVVTANVQPLPTVTSSSNGSIICTSGTTNLTATASAGAKIDWYADASGGTALATGMATFTTPTISANTTYYAEARDTIAGCISTSRTAVTATVSAVISVGITNNTGSTVLTCARTSISVTATGGTSYSWSNSLGSSANASITAAGTYTVTVTGANGCTATSSITVTSDISTPTIGITNNTGSTVLTCARTAISVTATGGSSYSWSNSLGSSANASITAAGTYTVTATGANGCTATSSITVTQDISSPSAPSGTGGSVCATGTVSISATPGAGETIDWYGASSGGAVLTSGSGVTSFTTPSISSTTTYYAETRNTNTGCTSTSRTAVTATVDVQSVAAAGADQSLCNTSTFTMAAVPTVGTGAWTIVSGTASITSSASATTKITAVPTNSSVTLRWAETNGTCSSSTDEIIIRNDALATVSNAGADQSLCNTAQFTLAGNNPSSGTGVWSLVGSSGGTSITNSLLRTSTVTNVPANTAITLRWSITNGSCVSTDDVIIRNNSLPDATISASGATTIAYGNSVTLAAPAVGNALTFNGTSNYLSIPSTLNSAITGNNITIEGWFYITSTFNLTGLVTEALGSNNNVKFGITSGVVSGMQKIYAGFINAGSSTTVTSSANLPLNTWTHIAATYDGASLNVYVNGTLTGTVANSSGLSAGLDTWYVGKAADGSSYFPGTIDEIRIWNVARIQSDINANKNSTIATNSNGLVGYYKLDENSGSTATDATGNGYMGTVN